VFSALHHLAGEYVSERLKIVVQSCGEMHGQRVTWEWSNRIVDAGVLGQDGGVISLALITNSQPWWGFGFLRVFRLEAYSSEESTGFRFVWPGEVGEGVEQERLSLVFSPAGQMVFQVEVEGSSPTRWELVRSGCPT
jgi:hypothetical protein